MNERKSRKLIKVEVVIERCYRYSYIDRDLVRDRYFENTEYVNIIKLVASGKS